jgi:hypothetical protein
MRDSSATAAAGGSFNAGCSPHAIYVVTLPKARVVMSSRPLMHNEKGNAIERLTKKPAKEIDGSVVLFLAYLELITVMPDQYGVTKTKFPAFSVWNVICAFLTGRPFYLYGEDEYVGRKLARFSIAVSCPYLLFAADQVVHAALCGDENLARRMIAASPRYLLSRENVTDFSGRVYTNITPFQAALISNDLEMVQMIKPFFKRLKNGEDEMRKQFLEIFPNGIEKCRDEQKKESEKKFTPMLKAVIDVIKNAAEKDVKDAVSHKQTTSKLSMALNTFRDAFKKLSDSEKVFNSHHMLTSHESVSEGSARFERLDYGDRFDLFKDQVVGFVERFSPTGHFCFGSIRTLGYFPLEDEATGLGYTTNYILNTNECRSDPKGYLDSFDLYSEFIEKKEKALRDLFSDSTLSPSHCLIA